MHAALVYLTGEFARQVLTGYADSGDSLEVLVNLVLSSREEARKKFYFPPGTDVLDAWAELDKDQVVLKLRHPDLPFSVTGLQLPTAQPGWKRKGGVVVFQNWGL